MLLWSEEKIKQNSAKSQIQVAADCRDSLGHSSNSNWHLKRTEPPPHFPLYAICSLQATLYPAMKYSILQEWKMLQVQFYCLSDLNSSTYGSNYPPKNCKHESFWITDSSLSWIWAWGRLKHTYSVIIDTEIALQPLNSYSHTTSSASTSTAAQIASQFVTKHWMELMKEKKQTKKLNM